MDFVDQAKQKWQSQTEQNKVEAAHKELLDTIIGGQRATVQAIVGLASVIKSHQPKVTVKHPITSVSTPDMRPLLQELQTLVDLEKLEKDDTVTPVVEAINKLGPILKAIPAAIEMPEAPEEVSVNNLDELKTTLEAILAVLKTDVEKDPVVIPTPEVFVDAADLSPLVDTFNKGMAKLEKAIKAIPQPVDDDSAVVEGLQAVKDQIAGIRFPIPNVITDPLVKYKVADMDDAGTVKYFGQIANDGSWVIMKEDDGATPKTIRYATGSGSYPTNWTGRAGLTYDYLYVAING